LGSNISYINVDPSLFSMVHSNLAADNAWYWQDDKGELQCGLLDWGGASHQNVAKSTLMSWTMAEPEMLLEHFDDLAQAFVDGVKDADGPPSITFEEFKTCVSICFAITNPGCGSNVMQLMKIMPKADWAKIKDRWDPVVNNRFLNRNYTCAMRVALMCWKKLPLYSRFQEWKKKNEHWFPNKKPFVCPEFPEAKAK